MRDRQIHQKVYVCVSVYVQLGTTIACTIWMFVSPFGAHILTRTHFFGQAPALLLCVKKLMRMVDTLTKRRRRLWRMSASLTTWFSSCSIYCSMGKYNSDASRVTAYVKSEKHNILDLTLTWKFSTLLEEVASIGTYIFCRNNAVSLFVYIPYIYMVRLYIRYIAICSIVRCAYTQNGCTKFWWYQ